LLVINSSSGTHGPTTRRISILAELERLPGSDRDHVHINAEFFKPAAEHLTARNLMSMWWLDINLGFSDGYSTGVIAL
jgi:hypothetical protein